MTGKSSSPSCHSWRDKVDAVQWDHEHTDHYLLARAMANRLDFPETSPSETPQKTGLLGDDVMLLHWQRAAYPYFTPTELKNALDSFRATVPSATREKLADLVPTTWLDPLLSGPNAAIPSTRAIVGTDIENLLRMVKLRIQNGGRE